MALVSRPLVRLLLALSLLSAAFLLPPPAPGGAPPAAAQAAFAYPLTVTDDSGVSTTFWTPPRRIVSLSPGHTETVFALGAGDRLVAVDTYADYPAEAAAIEPRLATFPTPSVETIVSLQPDLVLSLVEQDDVLAQLRQQGIPVLKLFPRDFEATTQEIELLGQVLGVAEQGAAIAADMRARRDAVVAAVADAPRPSVLYEMDASDPTKPFAAGPNGYYGQLVDLAGGSNIFADLPGDFGQVSAESVIARDPEVILLADAYSPFNPQTPAMVAERPGWQSVTAVQTGAVYAIQADLTSRPSPRLADGLETLAFLLHPDRFAEQGGPRQGASPFGAPFCSPGQAPTYTFGFAALAAWLGPTMGEPTECPHVDPANGDTYQQTTKGVALYRQLTNTPLFTSRGEHWALTADGPVSWTGPLALVSP